MNTISDGVHTVNIPDGLLWADEFAWAAVEQSVQRTITGALVVQVASRIGGRSITLAAEDDASGWVTRADVDQLRAWGDVPGQILTVAYRGVTRTVIWRHQDTAIDATPVAAFNDVQADDKYRVTLRFMEI